MIEGGIMDKPNDKDKIETTEEDENMDAVAKRPCTILESVEESFKQIKEKKHGKRKFKSLEESQNLWNKWAKEVEDESR